VPEDAIKIFVEFRRIESAIKGYTCIYFVYKISISLLCSCGGPEWPFFWRTSSTSGVLQLW